MPRLTATRTYEDNKTPLESDIDSFVDDIEILVNTTKLDNDNFQTAGITGSTKLIDESVSTANIRNNAVSTVKIQNSAVTTDKFEDNSLTTAKFASASVTNAKVPVREGLFPVGAVTKFHTYNNTVTVPRGWMLLDGDVVSEANYDAYHGAGAYAADGVSASPILAKNLPDMQTNYAIGVDATTKDGASAITTVGRANHTLTLTHSHSTTHAHGLDGSSAANEIRYEYGGTAVSKIFAVEDSGDPMKTDTTTITSSTNTFSTTIRPASIEVIFCMRVI